MGHLRRLHSYAHMWPPGVVEVDYAFEHSLAFSPRRDGHLVQPFRLQDAISAFRDGVLKRITALRHTDAYAMLLEYFYICRTTVLAASVGVVDETARRLVVYCSQSHVQGLQRVDCLKCGAHSPTDNLV